MMCAWDHIVRNFVGVLFGSHERVSPVGATMVRYTPGSSPLPQLDRRTLLRIMLAGAGVAATSGLAACGGGSSSGGDSKVVTFGNNLSDQVPKDAITAAVKAFEANSGGL